MNMDAFDDRRWQVFGYGIVEVKLLIFMQAHGDGAGEHLGNTGKEKRRTGFRLDHPGRTGITKGAGPVDSFIPGLHREEHVKNILAPVILMQQVAEPRFKTFIVHISASHLLRRRFLIAFI